MSFDDDGKVGSSRCVGVGGWDSSPDIIRQSCVLKLERSKLGSKVIDAKIDDVSGGDEIVGMNVFSGSTRPAVVDPPRCG